MKLKNIGIVAVFAAMAAACNPSYKATDRSRTATDSTSSNVDTTSMDKTPVDTSSIDRTSTDTSSSMNTTTTPVDTTSNSNVSSNTVTIPAGAEAAFKTQYPTATSVAWSNYDSLATSPIDWELTGWTPMESNDYAVQFNMDNDNYYAWYDSDGNWVGSTYKLKDPSKLPAAVSTAIKSKYADYTVSDINSEFAKGKTAYEIEMKKDNSKVKLLVDADGTIIKEKIK